MTVIAENGDQEEREIKVGINNRIQAEVLEGLSEGEHILLKTAATNKKAKLEFLLGLSFFIKSNKLYLF